MGSVGENLEGLELYLSMVWFCGCSASVFSSICASVVN